jgi:hypothetical protein
MRKINPTKMGKSKPALTGFKNGKVFKISKDAYYNLIFADTNDIKLEMSLPYQNIWS